MNGRVFEFKLIYANYLAGTPTGALFTPLLATSGSNRNDNTTDTIY